MSRSWRDEAGEQSSSGSDSPATLTKVPKGVCEPKSEEEAVAVETSEEGVISVLVIREPGTILALSEQSWNQIELASGSAIEQ